MSLPYSTFYGMPSGLAVGVEFFDSDGTYALPASINTAPVLTVTRGGVVFATITLDFATFMGTVPDVIPGVAAALAPLGITLLASDQLSISYPADWATFGDGTVGAYSGTIANAVDGATYALLDSGQNFQVGYCAEGDFSYASRIIKSNLIGRMSPITGALTLNSDGFPATIASSPLTGILVTMPAPDPQFSPLEGNTLGSGLCTARIVATVAPAPTVAPSGVGGVGWTATVTSETLSDDGLTRILVANVQATSGQRRSPDYRLDFYGTAVGDGTFQLGNGGTYTVEFYGPDPSDPTGMTAVDLATVPEWYQGYDYINDGIDTRRFLDPLATNDMWLHSVADLTTHTDVNLEVVSISAPTLYPATFDPDTWIDLEIKVASTSLLYPGLPITLNGCGTVTASDSTTWPLNSFIGPCYPKDATTVHVQLQASQAFGSARHMANTLTPSGGTLTAAYGGVASFPDMVTTCNRYSANFRLPIPPCATDALIRYFATYLAANLDVGLKVKASWANECWNFSFQTYYWARALSFIGGQATDEDFTFGYASQTAHALAVLEAAWVAAGRSAGDLILLYEGQGGDAGTNGEIASHVVAAGSPCDRFATAVYLDNTPFGISTSAITTAFQGLAGNAGLALDYFEQMLKVGGQVAYEIGQAVAALTSNGLTGVPIDCYEMALDLLTPGLVTTDGVSLPQAMKAHPRMRGLLLYWFQTMQAAGAVGGDWFYEHGMPGSQGGIFLGWGAYDSYLQGDGTGDYVTDALNITSPTDYGPVSSEIGSAIKAQNALASGGPPSPTLTISPSTATSSTTGGTVSVTATLTNSSASLAASVDHGTLSTGSPTSGTPITWTQPSGSGTATISFVDSTDSLSATCVIAYTATASPSLAVSPSTATSSAGGATVAITATRSRSSASLSASVSGGGTLSTASPTSGTAFHWTQPSSGSGTATVTVSDGTDSLSATCVITYTASVASTAGYYGYFHRRLAGRLF